MTQTAFHISCTSSITHECIHQIVFGYLDLYLLLFIFIKSDMTTTQKIDNSLRNVSIGLNRTNCPIVNML